MIQVDQDWPLTVSVSQKVRCKFSLLEFPQSKLHRSVCGIESKSFVNKLKKNMYHLRTRLNCFRDLWYHLYLCLHSMR